MRTLTIQKLMQRRDRELKHTKSTAQYFKVSERYSLLSEALQARQEIEEFEYFEYLESFGEYTPVIPD